MYVGVVIESCIQKLSSKFEKKMFCLYICFNFLWFQKKNYGWTHKVWFFAKKSLGEKKVWLGLLCEWTFLSLQEFSGDVVTLKEKGSEGIYRASKERNDTITTVLGQQVHQNCHESIAIWLLSMPACAENYHRMQELTGVQFYSGEQNKDMSKARQARDMKDTVTILNALAIHTPFSRVTI